MDAVVNRGTRAMDAPVTQRMDAAGDRRESSSGTTGFPRGAVLYHKGIVNEATFVFERAGKTERSRGRLRWSGSTRQSARVAVEPQLSLVGPSVFERRGRGQSALYGVVEEVAHPPRPFSPVHQRSPRSREA
ncbi:hypothetical protein C5E51_06910 [Nocardia nova]|nr:hypothetical protein C5E51_06910 [Nocardia nova]PPJ16436.1 hypothetical protein C5E44_18600 [Nocardia nova]